MVKMWSLSIAIILINLSVILGTPINRDASISIDQIQYLLYTKRSGANGYRLTPFDDSTIGLSGFLPTSPLKVLIHGFMDDSTNNVFTLPRDAFLSLNEDINVLAVDWSECSKIVLYDQVIPCARSVGEITGQVLQWLLDKTDLTRENIHVIAHSLGAQASAFIRASVIPGRITALDPAAPLYNHVGPEDRIDESDADFVEVIHTSTKFLGLPVTVGHIDFFPNGGEGQPGCSDIFGGCAHSTSYQYYAYTIREANRNAYRAFSCKTVDDARIGACYGIPLIPMGYATATNLRGIYYVNITEVPRF